MSDVIKTLESYPDISFIDDITLEKLQADMIEDFQKKYKDETGEEKVLGLGDPHRLMLYAASLQIYQALQYVDREGKQSLLKYAYGAQLENLGAFKKIQRSEGKPSSTTIRFSVSEVQDHAISIPSRTRCTAGDNVYFYTIEDTEIPPGSEYTDVMAECTEKGAFADGYKVGKLNKLVDPIAYIGSIANIEKTNGGADAETDKSLTERIYLAPSSYSVAGPEGAYAYWIKTFQADAADVKVNSPSAGIVDIRFILNGGAIPEQQVIEEIQKKISQREIRPLTDKIELSAPETINYNIELKYWINESDKSQSVVIQEKVKTAVSVYKIWQREKIGRDINPSKLLTLIIQAGAKRAEITEPAFIEISDISIAIPAKESVIYGGIEDD